MTNHFKRIANGAIKVVFAAGLIYWLVSSGKLNIRELTPFLKPEHFVVCLALLGAMMWLTSERWRGLLKSQGFNITSWEGFKLTLIGVFFNFAVPGGVGGDVVKGYYIVKDNPNAKLKSALTILMDRLLGLFSMLILAIVAALIFWDRVSANQQLHLLFWFLILCFVGFMFFWSFIFSRRLYESGLIQKLISKLPNAHKLEKIFVAFCDYRHKKFYFYSSIAISLLTQSCSIFFFIYTGEILTGGSVPLSIFFFVVPIGFMTTAIPIAPAGIGLGQAAFYYLFNLALGTNSNLGSNTITAFQGFSLLWGFVGAFFYLTRSKRAQHQMTTEEAST